MNDADKPQTKNPLGIRRILLAWGYSLAGLKHATTNEPAFQQELILVTLLTLAALIFPFSLEVTLAIIISHLFVLIVELINSAIEAVVDKASPEIHTLAKQAKDMGSAAVFLALLIAALVWGYAIYTHIYVTSTG